MTSERGSASSLLQDLGSAAGWFVDRVVSLAPHRSDYVQMRRFPRRNVVAGITVGEVALPLALALSLIHISEPT